MPEKSFARDKLTAPRDTVFRFFLVVEVLLPLIRTAMMSLPEKKTPSRWRKKKKKKSSVMIYFDPIPRCLPNNNKPLLGRALGRDRVPQPAAA